MRVRNSAIAQWLHERVLRHRGHLICRWLWCWHTMCYDNVPRERCSYCERGGQR